MPRKRNKPQKQPRPDKSRKRGAITFELSKSMVGGLFAFAASVVALYEAINYFRNDPQTFYFIIFPILAGVASLGLLIQAVRKKNSIAYAWLVVGMLIVTVTAIGWNSYVEGEKAKLIVVIATFAGPEEVYGLRNEIIENLDSNFSDDNDVRVIPIDAVVTPADGSDLARKLGKEKYADIVVWAWYQPTENPNITIHVENLDQEELSIMEESSRYQPNATLQDLQSFEIQKEVGVEATRLVSLLVGYVSLRSDDYQTALQLFERALVEKDNDILVKRRDLLFLAAACYFKIGDFEAAIQNYDEIIRTNPTDLLAYINRGNAYLYLGQQENSIRDFDKAVEINPNSAQALLMRAYFFIFEKQYQSAMADINRALEIDPNISAAYIDLGIIYGNQGQHELALQEFNKALNLQPNSFNALNNRGGTYNNLGEYRKAIEDYNKALKIRPESSIAYTNRGYSYEQLGKYEQALNDYTRAIQLDPKNEIAVQNRGILYGKLGEFSKATADFKKYEELTGKNP
jgi:tetratricopeptide (TPR) repeat protein